MSRTAIRCKCGQRISQREVMQTGYYPMMSGPSLVFVRFRCSRCKKLGQEYINQEEWEKGILQDASVEANAPERDRFTAMGPIEMRELVEFHNDLEALNDLSGLNAEFSRERETEEKDQRSKG